MDNAKPDTTKVEKAATPVRGTIDPAPQAQPVDDYAPDLRCNQCGWHGCDEDLVASIDTEDCETSRPCPDCGTDAYLMDAPWSQEIHVAEKDAATAWNRRALPAARAEVSVAEAARVLLDGCPNPLFDMLKPTLMGGVKEVIPCSDEYGEESSYERPVSWTAMKEIVALALRAITEAGG